MDGYSVIRKGSWLLERVGSGEWVWKMGKRRLFLVENRWRKGEKKGAVWKEKRRWRCGSLVLVINWVSCLMSLWSACYEVYLCGDGMRGVGGMWIVMECSGEEMRFGFSCRRDCVCICSFLFTTFIWVC